MNLFLGNLVRQLARKRIARRDAIALPYISQLILTSQTAMARERAAQEETVEETEQVRFIASLRQVSSELASLGNQQSAGASAEPVKDRSAPPRTLAKPRIASPKPCSGGSLDPCSSVQQAQRPRNAPRPL